MLVYLLIILLILSVVIIAFLYNKNKSYKNRITGLISAAMLTPEELEKHGIDIAKNHTECKRMSSCTNLLPRMEENYKHIINAYKELNEDISKGEDVIPAAEWLFDNFYIIEEQVKEIRMNFPKAYQAVLPCLEKGLLKGFPRIYDIALELISHTESRIDEKLLIRFINAYQSRVHLTSGELWALPIMLKIALIESIRQICDEILISQKKRKIADKLSDMILDENGEDLKEKFKTFTNDLNFLNPAFAERLLMRLRRQENETSSVMHFINERLASQGTNADEIIKIEHQDQAKKQVLIGNSITSLRLISGMDWQSVFESLSPVEQILRRDPAGIYKGMDFASRDYYRHAVEEIARRLKISEVQVARKAVECCEKAADSLDSRIKHVGYYIIGSGRQKLEKEIGYRPGFFKGLIKFIKKHPTAVYLFLTISITFAISALFAIVVQRFNRSLWITVLAFLVSILPASEISIEAVNWLITHILAPSFLPKLELREGIPEEFSSIVVIPALLPNPKRAKELLEDLEVYYLANHEKNLYFALLGDFTDAKDKNMPEDDEIIKTAVDTVKTLNKKYSKEGSDIFYFFMRYRKYNQSQGVWMGWERKRGKLMEFNRLLRGDESTSYYIKSGDLTKIPKIKYVITLDADTELPINAARKLIGAISHPLNRAIVDEEKLKVIQGYGVLQPRISINVVNAGKSVFSKIFAGIGGIDPYTCAVSDIYMDLFGEGIYTGKGIYDVDVFLKVMDGYIPENAVLSHDLLEGSYARAALVTDIELIDGFPSKYSSYSARMHRWVRGDWQLIPWLFRKVKDKNGRYVKNPLSIINKWKILDNLRRSLMPISLFVLIILSMCPISVRGIIWLLLVLFTIAFPVLLELLDIFFTKDENQVNHVFEGSLNILLQTLLIFVFLPYTAYLMSDAVIRTIIRLLFTKRNLLEWETAADAEVRLKNDLKSYIKRLWICPISALSVIVLYAYFLNMPFYMPFSIAAIWGVSPYIAWYVSQNIETKFIRLSEEDIKELRLIFRKTWRYFEEFVSSKENYLPPDNFQEDPPNGIAHRTSPTNIGLYLVSVLAARDMGYISTLELIDRLNKCFNTMDKLDKWKGHFYNWYDTRNLQALKPLYVSTVDSGNLIGYLIVLNEGILEYMRKPLMDSSIAEGLIDTIEIYNSELKSAKLDCSLLKSFVQKKGIDLNEWLKALKQIEEAKDELEKKVRVNFYYSSIIDSTIESFKMEISLMLPWVDMIDTMPEMLKDESGQLGGLSRDLFDLIGKLKSDISLIGIRNSYKDALSCLNSMIQSVPEGFDDVSLWLRDLKKHIMNSYLDANKALCNLKDLYERSRKIIQNTEFKPLFDESRQLFSIGYNADDEQLNRSYYDLLASEARQTSFIAIAKGEIEQKHWFRLGRLMTGFDKYKGLVSWSGTMFEYLMPLLIMKNYSNTLLDRTYKFALKSQIAYGRMRDVPWGVSESGFYAFDIALNYQYKAFGIPRLGLKRGLVNDIVIAPYATILALMVDPSASIENIKVLKKEGLEGLYGFYEAADYTKERLPAGKKFIVVKSYMVHHHGMSLLALDNILNGNIMQERFHRNPLIKAAELLLQEKVPGGITLTKDIEKEKTPEDYEKHKIEEFIWKTKSPVGPFPEAHIISNGSYYTVLTNSGGGFSRCGEISINRWKEQLSGPVYGMYFYIQNLNSNDVWSAAFEPYNIVPEEYNVIFSSDKVEYFRTDGSIDTHTEVVVSPEDNVEIRKLSLTNHSSYYRDVEVTSYFEVVLSTKESDEAHRVFNNLFVKTEFLPQSNTLLAVRRPRDSKQKMRWLFHTVFTEGESIGAVQYETDRMKFIGRGRSLKNPCAMDVDHPLSNSSGAVLDPIMSLRRRIRIKPGETAKISYITGIADTKDEACILADKYKDNAAIKRTFELAWTKSQVEARYLNLRSREVELYQKMLPHILYISPLRRKIEEEITKNVKGQSGLWPYGISGDMPIVLLTVNSNDDLDIVKEILKAHEYFRSKGFKFDLVILNEDSGDYIQSFNNRIKDVIQQNRGGDLQDRPGGIFLRQANSMPEESRNLLYAVSRLVFSGKSGSLRQQIRYDEFVLNYIKAQEEKYAAHYVYEEPVEPEERLMFYNSLGGFKMDGSEYVIKLTEDEDTPAPWSNVICNENFGFLITSSGSGFTWAENSREYKLSPWSNDPVSDPPGEVVYLSDEEDGGIWSITPLPIREKEAYIIRHGFGYSMFLHTSRGIKQEMLVFTPKNDRVKVIKVKLKNISKRKRKIKIAFYVRPVLGVSDQHTAPFIITQVDESGVLLIKNTYSDDFKGRVVFADCSIKERSITGDRREFFGIGGGLDNPVSILNDSLSGRTGAGYDPCAAIMVKAEFEQNEEKVIIFTLGEAEDDKNAVDCALKYRDIYEDERAYREVRGFWNKLLGTIQVKTPDDSLNIMANGWLLYQTISCRIWARSAFYQSGGAYGFRDQLQDVMAAVYVCPEITKNQILLHSAHQYLEGDVQHWWHPVTEKGIRTRFSDDLLWLPYVTADYINVTGDKDILDKEVSYLEDEPLKDEEEERYNRPKISDKCGTVYEHCIKAIEYSLKFGEHGIPLMGTGDWNDGMSSVGNKGRGESIWLGWFLYKILKMFAPILNERGDCERADKFIKTADDIVSSIEKFGWDGSWYRRAYFDSGIPLGSASNSECQIDSIAQSWSIISEGGMQKRTEEAMMALDHYLIKRDEGIIKLLTPPFEAGDLEPGYIKGYIPGVRENGGQYTHAAVWVILAYAMMGMGDKAWELYSMINPINHSLTPVENARYKVEPYVIAADVYAVDPNTGRGGWTWYTGASGWMYRVLIEHMLGLKLRGDKLIIDPCIPSKWNEYTIKYRYVDTQYFIIVKNISGINEGIDSITLDGKLMNEKFIPLVNDKKEHFVEVKM